MKKLIITAILCASFIGMSNIELRAQAKSEDPKFADTEAILGNYGFKNGFDASIIPTSPLAQLSIIAMGKYGAIEGEPLIDTAEEFITASYYSTIKVDAKAQAAIDKELPKGKAGALRLGAMWYLKYLGSDGCKTAIKLIMEESNVTRGEIISYYEAALKNKINNTPINKPVMGKQFTKEEEAMLKKLLSDFINAPTQETARAMYLFYMSMAESNQYKIEPMNEFFYNVSSTASNILLLYIIQEINNTSRGGGDSYY